MPTQLVSILASASLIMSFPVRCLPTLDHSIALPFYSIQSHLITILNLATAFQRVSFPLPCKSGRHFAVTFLNLSSRHCSIANHFFAIAMIYHPWQFLTPLRHFTANLLSSNALRFGSLPLHFEAFFAFALPCFSIAIQVTSSLFHSVANLGPCISLLINAFAMQFGSIP